MSALALRRHARHESVPIRGPEYVHGRLDWLHKELQWKMKKDSVKFSSKSNTKIGTRLKGAIQAAVSKTKTGPP
jgi:hypothetical protein